VISLHLLILAAVVCVVAQRVLTRAGSACRSPLWGLAAWYAVLATVGLALAAAVLSLAVGWPGVRSAVCNWWAWCLQAVRGADGPAGRIAVGVAAAVLAVVALRAVRIGWRLGRAFAQRRANMPRWSPSWARSPRNWVPQS
jgi:hypothetical protein